MKTLNLCLNCKYIITKNINNKLGLTNGAEVILREIYKNNNNEDMPSMLLVELVSSKKIIGVNNQTNIFPIFPTRVTFNKNIKLSANQSKNITISKLQYTLIPAFCSVSFNIQGKTFDKIIVDLSMPVKGNLDLAYAYVVLSRVRSINDLLILRPFSKEIFNLK